MNTNTTTGQALEDLTTDELVALHNAQADLLWSTDRRVAAEAQSRIDQISITLARRAYANRNH